MKNYSNDRMIDPCRVFKENRAYRVHQTSLVMLALVLATLIVGVAGFESLAA